MDPTIDKAFVKQFEVEVHLAYQRQGSKLRPYVRNKTGVKGATTVFQTVGKGVASTKSRHGQIPAMNLEHGEPVECHLQDWYAGEWVDRMDELKLNIEERQIVANSGAYALGRKTDDLIIAELNKAALDTTRRIFKATLNKNFNAGDIHGVLSKLGQMDIPDDGERVAIVGWKQWTRLLALEEFSSADYVGGENLPLVGMSSDRPRQWLGTLWMPISGLEYVSGPKVRCFWFHKSAIGYATGAEIVTDITWHGDRASHFVNNMMSQGACVIDPKGIVAMEIGE